MKKGPEDNSPGDISMEDISVASVALRGKIW